MHVIVTEGLLEGHWGGGLPHPEVWWERRRMSDSPTGNLEGEGQAGVRGQCRCRGLAAAPMPEDGERPSDSRGQLWPCQQQLAQPSFRSRLRTLPGETARSGQRGAVGVAASLGPRTGCQTSWNRDTLTPCRSLRGTLTNRRLGLT